MTECDSLKKTNIIIKLIATTDTFVLLQEVQSYVHKCNSGYYFIQINKIELNHWTSCGGSVIKVSGHIREGHMYKSQRSGWQ